jgi:hypothetical protein
MKKMILSVVFLLALASLSYAADKKQTADKKTENKSILSGNTSAIAAASYTAVLEENSRLKLQASELANKIEDLNSRLEYSQMMYTTISSLQQTALNLAIEDTKCQLDYVRMMSATLLSLQLQPSR